MTVDKRRLAIDIIVPLYNEEQVVAEFHRQLMHVVMPLYVGYIFQEVKRRPVYLLRDVDRSAGDRPPRAGDGQEP